MSTDFYLAVERVLKHPKTYYVLEQVKFPGQLEEVSFPQVLNYLFWIRENGTLVIENEAQRVLVHFHYGNPRRIDSDFIPEANLVQILLKTGKLSETKFNALYPEPSQKEHVNGELLLQKGLLSSHDLYEALKLQALEKILYLFCWKTGSFRFEFKDRFEGDTFIDASPGEIILTGIRRYYNLSDYWSLFEPYEGAMVLLKKTTPYDIESLKLLPQERRLLSFVNGERTLKTLLSSGRMSLGENLNFLFGLILMGVIELQRPGEDLDEGSIAPEKGLKDDLDEAYEAIMGEISLDSDMVTEKEDPSGFEEDFVLGISSENHAEFRIEATPTQDFLLSSGQPFGYTEVLPKTPEPSLEPSLDPSETQHEDAPHVSSPSSDEISALELASSQDAVFDVQPLDESLLPRIQREKTSEKMDADKGDHFSDPPEKEFGILLTEDSEVSYQNDFEHMEDTTDPASFDISAKIDLALRRQVFEMIGKDPSEAASSTFDEEPQVNVFDDEDEISAQDLGVDIPPDQKEMASAQRAFIRSDEIDPFQMEAETTDATPFVSQLIQETSAQSSLVQSENQIQSPLNQSLSSPAPLNTSPETSVVAAKKETKIAESDPPGTYFQWLEISESASRADIQKAYVAQLNQITPKLPDPEAYQMLDRLKRAYHTLSDPKTRRAYERSLLNAYLSTSESLKPPNHAAAELAYKHGLSLLNEQKLPEAEGYLRQAVYQSPHETRYKAYLGWLFWQLPCGKSEIDEKLPIAWISEHIQKNPEDWEPLYFLGHIYKALRRFVLARQMMMRVIRIRPDFDAAKKILES